jgi:hypothetical protein
MELDLGDLYDNIDEGEGEDEEEELAGLLQEIGNTVPIIPVGYRYIHQYRKPYPYQLVDAPQLEYSLQSLQTNHLIIHATVTLISN